MAELLPTQAVILAGGQGTRLGLLTQDTPKPLLPVAGSPFLGLLIRQFALVGLRHFLVSAGFMGDKLRNFAKTFRHELPAGSTLKVVIEKAPLGTGGALALLADQLQPEFLLLNGDSWFDFDIKDFLVRPFDDSALIKIALREVSDASRYGAVCLEDSRVAIFGEKCRAGAGLINTGVYHVRRDLLTYIPSSPCSLEADVLPALVPAGKVDGYCYEGYFIDIGVPDSYVQAQAELPAKFPHLFKPTPTSETNGG